MEIFFDSRLNLPITRPKGKLSWYTCLHEGGVLAKRVWITSKIMQRIFTHIHRDTIILELMGCASDAIIPFDHFHYSSFMPNIISFIAKTKNPAEHWIVTDTAPFWASPWGIGRPTLDVGCCGMMFPHNPTITVASKLHAGHHNTSISLRRNEVDGLDGFQHCLYVGRFLSPLPTLDDNVFTILCLIRGWSADIPLSVIREAKEMDGKFSAFFAENTRTFISGVDHPTLRHLRYNFMDTAAALKEVVTLLPRRDPIIWVILIDIFGLNYP